MPLPAITVVAACGSIITAFKSGWELSRMLKKKDLEVKMDSEATAISNELHRAYKDGRMSEQAYEKWYDRFIVALAEKDGMEIRKVRKHLDLLKAAPRHHSNDREKSRSERRRDRDDEDRYASQRKRHSSYDSGYESAGYDRYVEPPQHRPSLTYSAPGSYYNTQAQAEADEARRRYSTNSYALPSPYLGELVQYAPSGEGQMQRSSSTHGRPVQGRSRSSSGAGDRGRQRSRSVRPEARIREEESEDDEEDYDRRREGYGRQYR